MVSQLSHEELIKFIELGMIFDNYTSQRYLLPEQRYHAILTYLSTALELERVMLLDVSRRRESIKVEAAKGGNTLEEHIKINEKIKGMPFIDRLMDYNPNNDKRLNERVKTFNASLETGGILGRVLAQEEPLIAHPDNVDMSNDNNKALFDAYSDSNKGNVPILLIPLKGVNQKVFGILGGSNPYSEKNLDKAIRLAEYPQNQIRNASQKQKTIEDYIRMKVEKETLIREEKKRFEYLKDISSTFAHEIRNPLVAVGGFARRLGKKIKGDEVAESKYGTEVGIILNESERLERFLRQFTGEIGSATVYSFREANLPNIITQVYSVLHQQYPDASLNLEIKSDNSLVRGDPENIAGTFKELLTRIILSNGQDPIFIKIIDEKREGNNIFLPHSNSFAVSVIASDSIRLTEPDIHYVNGIRSTCDINYQGDNDIVHCLIETQLNMLLNRGKLEIPKPYEPPQKIKLYFPGVTNGGH